MAERRQLQPPADPPAGLPRVEDLVPDNVEPGFLLYTEALTGGMDPIPTSPGELFRTIRNGSNGTHSSSSSPRTSGFQATPRGGAGTGRGPARRGDREPTGTAPFAAPAPVGSRLAPAQPLAVRLEHWFGLQSSRCPDRVGVSDRSGQIPWERCPGSHADKHLKPLCGDGPTWATMTGDRTTRRLRRARATSPPMRWPPATIATCPVSRAWAAE